MWMVKLLFRSLMIPCLLLGIHRGDEIWKLMEYPFFKKGKSWINTLEDQQNMESNHKKIHAFLVLKNMLLFP